MWWRKMKEQKALWEDKRKRLWLGERQKTENERTGVARGSGHLNIKVMRQMKRLKEQRECKRES